MHLAWSSHLRSPKPQSPFLSPAPCPHLRTTIGRGWASAASGRGRLVPPHSAPPLPLLSQRSAAPARGRTPREAREAREPRGGGRRTALGPPAALGRVCAGEAATAGGDRRCASGAGGRETSRGAAQGWGLPSSPCSEVGMSL